MPVPYGMLSTLDTLASNFQTIAQIGEDRAYESIRLTLDAHNRLVDEMLGDFVQPTTDRLRRFGTAAAMTMEKLSEHGVPSPQKILPGVNVGFPLDNYGAALSWTRDYFEEATGDEIAGQIVALMDADARNLMYLIKNAIFSPTNYSFDDYLVDHLSQIQLPILALLNADGKGIPAGPNGETFDGTSHTHYLGYASGAVADSDVQAVLETVLEHFAAGEGRIFINRSQEAFIRGLTPNFVPYLQSGVVAENSLRYSIAKTLDTLRLYNRAIGTYRGAEVWIKPWMPANYIFAWLKGAPAPLVFRSKRAGSGELRLVAEDESYPMRAKMYRRQCGIGVWTRNNGAVLYTGGTSYTAPTLTN